MSTTSATSSTSSDATSSDATTVGDTTLSDSTNGLSSTLAEYGLVSGIDTSEIVDAELAQYEEPVDNLEEEQKTLASDVTDYQTINSDLLSLEGTAAGLSLTSGWEARTATSSDTSVATATAESGTPAGTVQFTVNQLATTDSIYSSGTVASTSQVVTTASDLLLSQGANQLGFSSLTSTSGVTQGSHTFDVTQSSQAAYVAGSTDLESQSGDTSITSSNDTVDVTANGQSYTLTLAAGDYSSSQLLTAVQDAITTAGAGAAVQAGYNGSGQLVLSTVDQGSSQSLSVTGGSALSTLGLSSPSAAAATGVDAVVEVDGVSNDISTVTPGSTVTLDGADGATYTATLADSSSQSYVDSPLVSSGTVTATDVSTGTGSLSDIVSAINNSGTGIVASAVEDSAGQYVLQLTSSTTGEAGDLSIGNAFAGSALGDFDTAVAGQDAELQVGGTSGFTVSSSTNTFTGLLSGLTITAQSVSTTPVTVSVSNDVSSIASSIQSMVTAANQTLTDLQTYAGYDSTTDTGGALMGSAALTSLTNEILGAFSSTAGSSDLGSPSSIGLSIDDGQITFDEDTFEAAYDADPTEVEDMFTQGGTFNASSSSYSGGVTLSYASNSTQAGTYDVDITQSATQATDTGTTQSGGTVGTAENLSITSDGATATYATTAGESLTEVASGLNAAFASAGLGVSAEVNSDDQLELVSSDYGSAQSFTVTSDTNALGLAGTFTGQDVEGTINGVTATGDGQFLTAPTSDSTLGGLSLLVTASGITSSTDIGTYTYEPGLAQTLANISDEMADPVNGILTTTISGLQTQSTDLDPEITMYQNIVTEEQKMLNAQFADMETSLEDYKNQSSALTEEMDSIAANDSSTSS